jgi:hypothetical protein
LGPPQANGVAWVGLKDGPLTISPPIQESLCSAFAVAMYVIPHLKWPFNYEKCKIS